MMFESHESGIPFEISLVEPHSTPHTALSVGPAQILTSRHLRSCSPVTSEYLKLQVVDIRNEKLLRQDSLKKSFDKSARVSSDKSVPGDRVVVRKKICEYQEQFRKLMINLDFS
ncbi:hypothetical protein JTB14_019637 [Gonioctena quinquepunctata]|nr:hypothetical protein JTB14_019637 [Gonioctena quinquepunctata]